MLPRFGLVPTHHRSTVQATPGALRDAKIKERTTWQALSAQRQGHLYLRYLSSLNGFWAESSRTAFSRRKPGSGQIIGLIDPFRCDLSADDDSNIVLRDGCSLDGGYVRAGAIHFDDGEVKPNGGFYLGAPLAGGRVLLGANVQGRYNPKIKSSLRYSDSPENDAAFATNSFDNREDQTDTRDGTDHAGNIAWGIDAGD